MTKLDVMLWNKNKTESVRASKIRSFGIYGGWDSKGYKLLGWFSKDEYFHFGSWETAQQAQMFLMDLHRQIEGR